MAKIEFPKQLKALLEGSKLKSPIEGLADRVSEILTANKLVFFPAYTDHGVDHINAVLKAEVELVPHEVWKNSKSDSDPRLLCDVDAVVIIGATLLHDLAMLLSPSGFHELVSKDSRFKPLSWFKDRHVDHSADKPWDELWEEYEHEARRFSHTQLVDIIGEESTLAGWKYTELNQDKGQWTKSDELIIGEFIRRHHARLAHEIAIYGFPGLLIGSGDKYFPAMGKEESHVLRGFADLIGLTARSHGTSLRVCMEYLKSSREYAGTPRPMGTAVLYPMALLRVADYLQIDSPRAPEVLLHLLDPQSPISVQEWRKHHAVEYIGPGEGSHSKMVKVRTDVPLSLYLQLQILLAGLQKEMDHSTAVLDEAYGNYAKLGLDQLNLEYRRVYSNLNTPPFRDGLPYVPSRTGFTADPNLLSLLVEPLYGREPSVGVRELMQNAVDAVRELDVWCKNHKRDSKSLDLPEQDSDVLIDFIQQENGTWLLRVSDRGIGMTSDTIQNYFLRAGASFRTSKEWAKEFLDDKGQANVLRAGRFGIGVFAVFLLGPSFKMWTRHVNADKSSGFTVEASATSQLIEIARRNDLPIGTTIEVELNANSIRMLGLEGKIERRSNAMLQQQVDWFCWDWPLVNKLITIGTTKYLIPQRHNCPIRHVNLPPEWFVVRPSGFDSIFWTFDECPSLSCNGIKIEFPQARPSRESFIWTIKSRFNAPNIAVLDSKGNLDLTTQRYELSDRELPFSEDLMRDVIFSVIAHALVCGPNTRLDALANQKRHPLTTITDIELSDDTDWSKPIHESSLVWGSNSSSFVLLDPWLNSLLNSEFCLLLGKVKDIPRSFGATRKHDAVSAFGEPVLEIDTLVLILDVTVIPSNEDSFFEDVAESSAQLFSSLAGSGLPLVLGPIVASKLICSQNHEPNLEHYVEGSERLKWERIPSKNGKRRFHLATSGLLESMMPLESLLLEAEGNSDLKEILFALELTFGLPDEPQSMVAKIWKECLGKKAIPFDPIAREALIEEGSKHVDLKRHIDAWQEMKQSGSKWATRK